MMPLGDQNDQIVVPMGMDVSFAESQSRVDGKRGTCSRDPQRVQWKGLGDSVALRAMGREVSR